MFHGFGAIAFAQVLAAELNADVEVGRLERGGLFECGDCQNVICAGAKIGFAQGVIKIEAAGIEDQRFVK